MGRVTSTRGVFLWHLSAVLLSVLKGWGHIIRHFLRFSETAGGNG